MQHYKSVSTNVTRFILFAGLETGMDHEELLLMSDFKLIRKELSLI